MDLNGLAETAGCSGVPGLIRVRLGERRSLIPIFPLVGSVHVGTVYRPEITFPTSLVRTALMSTRAMQRARYGGN